MTITYKREKEPTFNAARFKDLKEKLNPRTQKVLDAVFKSLGESKNLADLIYKLENGVNLEIEVTTVHITDFINLKKKIEAQLRWFFPKNTINFTRKDENTVVLSIKDDTTYNLIQTLNIL